MYKEAAEKAYRVWIAQHGQPQQLLQLIAQYAQALCGGEINVSGSLLYDQIKAAPHRKKERNTIYHEIVRAWNALPDYLRGLAVGAVVAEDRPAYLQSIATQDKATAAAVAELIPLGEQARAHDAPDFQQ
jgi:hypothetical protein